MKSIEYRPPDGWPEGITLHSKLIPGYSTLTINEVGHIRSCKKRGPWGLSDRWTALSIHQIQPGAPWTHLIWKGGSVLVAHLVMDTHGAPRPGKEYRLYPIDGNLENHCLWNLEWRIAATQKGVPYFPTNPLKLLGKKPKDRTKRKAFTLTRDEIAWAYQEWKRGRSALTMWRELHQDKCSFPAFYQRVRTYQKKA